MSVTCADIYDESGPTGYTYELGGATKYFVKGHWHRPPVGMQAEQASHVWRLNPFVDSSAQIGKRICRLRLCFLQLERPK